MKEGERYYSNDQGGTRLATAPGSTALGEHGHRIIIDDPINAAAADATSRVVLEATNEWYDATVTQQAWTVLKPAEPYHHNWHMILGREIAAPRRRMGLSPLGEREEAVE